LLGAGKVVSVDRLLEAVYGEDLPPTARTQAQMSVSSLRRLFAAHGDETAISSRAQGYVLQVGGGWLDSGRFTELVAAAGVARESGDLDQAVAGLRDALRLWRGPALEGIDSQLIRAAASRLDEERIAAIETRLALELDLGRHHELAGELAELVGEFPLREGLRGQLMLALYRCGRTAEALAAYRQARQTMIEELGIEPGERLQQLERAILNSDPVLAPEAGPVTILLPGRLVPRLLPAGIADFTGRTGEIGQIRCRLMHAAGEEHRIAVPVVVIAGKGGVGKTSIAVRASHEMAGHFADGQLFADLHGGTSRPVSAAEVLERFLRALGVPGAQVPDGLDERAEMYRNLVAGRKILVVLDDAAGEGQVSSLLPGGGAGSPGWPEPSASKWMGSMQAARWICWPASSVPSGSRRSPRPRPPWPSCAATFRWRFASRARACPRARTGAFSSWPSAWRMRRVAWMNSRTQTWAFGRVSRSATRALESRPGGCSGGWRCGRRRRSRAGWVPRFSASPWPAPGTCSMS
jgi:DNA-binding SARP family transcriptional activator